MLEFKKKIFVCPNTVFTLVTISFMLSSGTMHTFPSGGQISPRYWLRFQGTFWIAYYYLVSRNLKPVRKTFK